MCFQIRMSNNSVEDVFFVSRVILLIFARDFDSIYCDIPNQSNSSNASYPYSHAGYVCLRYIALHINKKRNKTPETHTVAQSMC